MQKKIPTLLIFWLIALSCLAQAELYTWQTETIKNLKSNEENPYVCTFKIYPDDRIEWIQGSVVYSFDITSTQGSLPAEGTGSVTYNLIKEVKAGKVVVERQTGNRVVLTLDLSEGNDLGAYFSFQISNP